MIELPLADLMEDESLGAEWNQLAADLGRSYFQTHDWVAAWWSTLGGRCAGRGALWRDAGGKLEGVVALADTREALHSRIPYGVKVLVNAGTGSGAADHAGWPIVDRRLTDAAGWIASAGSRRTLLLRNLDPALESLAPEGAVPAQRTRCPVLEVPADLQIGSTKLRKQLRYYRKKLDEAGVTIDYVAPAQVDEALVDTLLALHSERSDMADRMTSFDESKREFHLRLAAAGEGERGPAAFVARVEDRPVGLLYGFWAGDTFAYYQSGWVPEMAGMNLGTVLVHEAITVTAHQGAKRFDLLRGPEPYKYRLGAVDVVETSWLLARGPGGWALQQFEALRRRRKRDSAPDDVGGR